MSRVAWTRMAMMVMVVMGLVAGGMGRAKKVPKWDGIGHRKTEAPRGGEGEEEVPVHLVGKVDVQVKKNVDGNGTHVADLRYVNERGEQVELLGLELQEGSGLAHARVVVAGEPTQQTQDEVRASVNEAKQSSTFVKKDGADWVMVTRFSKHHVHVVHFEGDHMVHIQPFAHAKDHLKEHDRRRLGAAANEEHDHVMTRRLESTDDLVPTSGGCGAKGVDGREVKEFQQSEAHTEGLTFLRNAKPLDSLEQNRVSSSRGAKAPPSRARSGRERRLQVFSKYANNLYFDRTEFWSGCYPGMGDIHYTEIGVVLDRAFVDSYGGAANALKALEAAVESANMIFTFQVNMQLRLRQVLVVTGTLPFPFKNPINNFYLNYFDGTESCPLDGDPGSVPETCVCDWQQGCGFGVYCGMSINLSALAYFSFDVQDNGVATYADVSNTFTFDDPSIETSSFSHMANWHLLTGCFDGNGVVGIAFALTQVFNNRRGTVCDRDGINTGVTTRLFENWLTFTHEIGHNFGLRHSFEDGQGQTGGIMDYGANTFQGVVQFNKKYRRTELCNEITQIKSQGACDYSGGASLFGPDGDSCVPDAVDPATYRCHGGWCPVVNGTINKCRPIPPVLVFDGVEIEHYQGVIGQPISGFGTPVEKDWVDANAEGVNLCNAVAGTPFTTSEIILFSPAGNLGCTFDSILANTLSAGARDVVVVGPNEEFTEMGGTDDEIEVRAVFVRASDGASMSAAIAASGSPIPGYLGAAPLAAIDPKDFERVFLALPTEDEFPLIPVLLGSIAGAMFALAAVLLYLQNRRASTDRWAAKQLANLPVAVAVVAPPEDDDLARAIERSKSDK